MQKDFHYGATYVLARIAGIAQDKASVIAHAAQYVDNGTYDGPVDIPGQSTYYCIRSAHDEKSLFQDWETILDSEFNHEVWAAFHFLPGNDNLSADSECSNEMTKVLCKPNSLVAQDLIAECLRCHQDVNAYERLGITMHVYADTWAHQEFAGIKNTVLNKVQNVYSNDIQDVFVDLADASGLPPLGHLQAWKNPDYPYLKWNFVKNGVDIPRDNTETFLDAAVHLVDFMREFVDPNATPSGLSSQDYTALTNVMTSNVNKDEDARLQKWYEAVERGDFSFGAEIMPQYDQTIYDSREFSQDEDIAGWLNFHDALRQHRTFVLETLLPKFGIAFPD